jgi:hypothetical protein
MLEMLDKVSIKNTKKYEDILIIYIEVRSSFL